MFRWPAKLVLLTFLVSNLAPFATANVPGAMTCHRSAVSEHSSTTASVPACHHGMAMAGHPGEDAARPASDSVSFSSSRHDCCTGHCPQVGISFAPRALTPTESVTLPDLDDAHAFTHEFLPAPRPSAGFDSRAERAPPIRK